MDPELTFQVDLIARLILASALGAAIGVEREIHEHPAGMRTHLLVALGSGLFTVLSIVGFPSEDGSATDPSRVAAQIVTGIGFLGAGAIIKYGPSVRGLTTAASLWAAAGIGMAAGAGQPILAIAATIIVVLSLWPLRVVRDRLEPDSARQIHVRAQLEAPARTGQLLDWLAERRVEIIRVDSERTDVGHQQLDLVLGLSADVDRVRLVEEIEALEGVTLGEIGRESE